MKKRLWVVIVIAIVGGLVVLRLALPSIIKKKANQKLAALPDYTGHVDRVSLALWRGDVGLHDVFLRHRTHDASLAIPDMEARIRWRPLFHHRIVLNLNIFSPRAQMVLEAVKKAAAETNGTEKKKSVTALAEARPEGLPDELRALIPFQIDDIFVKDGRIRVRTNNPDIKNQAREGLEKGTEKDSVADARVTDLKIHIQNLSNIAKDTRTLMATGEVSAKIMDDGDFLMHLRLAPLAKAPTFKMDARVTHFDLTTLNPVLRDRWGIDIKRGRFDLYAEAAAAEGRFEGYVKLFIKKLGMVDVKKEKNPVKIVKEAIVGAVAKVLQSPKEKVATRVPFEGRFDNPKIGLWEAVTEVLQNALLRALQPGLDKSVNIDDAKK
jgi:hypothetical protein